jgi:hypothetical protein
MWIDPCQNITGRTRACRGLVVLRGVSRRLVETESGSNERLYLSHPVPSRAQSASSAPYRTSRVPIEHLGMKKSKKVRVEAKRTPEQRRRRLAPCDAAALVRACFSNDSGSDRWHPVSSRTRRSSSWRHSWDTTTAQLVVSQRQLFRGTLGNNKARIQLQVARVRKGTPGVTDLAESNRLRAEAASN